MTTTPQAGPTTDAILSLALTGGNAPMVTIMHKKTGVLVLPRQAASHQMTTVLPHTSAAAHHPQETAPMFTSLQGATRSQITLRMVDIEVRTMAMMTPDGTAAPQYDPSGEGIYEGQDEIDVLYLNHS